MNGIHARTPAHPITNDHMRENRFLRWHEARRKLAAIRSHLLAGGHVQVCTYTRATIYGPKHVDWFTGDKHGIYVKRGKGKDCIDRCGIRFSRLEARPDNQTATNG